MKTKLNIPFSPPDITDMEINEVIDALKSGWITTGPKTKEFENELSDYVGTNKFVCLNSATAAMELTLRLLGIGPGDEVIVPAYTYTASCSVICHVGATPVMVDVAEDTFELNYQVLDELITEKTKAIIPVDLAGIICDYEKIVNVLESNKALFNPNKNTMQKDFDRVIMISDCAHGFGAIVDGKKAGNIADFTCFSFHAVKNLTTAEGGAVTWKSREGLDDNLIYNQYQLMSLHGQTKDALSKNKLGSWEYDIITPAYKCNMTDIQAAIGIAQLKRYPNLLKRRHDIIKIYDRAFKELNVKLLDHMGDNHISSGHLYFVRVNGITVEQRNLLIEEMAKKGIACNVHYKPLPLLTAYKNLGFDIIDFPNAYKQYANEITLPLYSTLNDDEVKYIIQSFKEVLTYV